MRRVALALLAFLPTAGCGAAQNASGDPLKLVDAPRTIDLGMIGAPLAVDGEALVHVAYRRDRTLVVRRDLRSGVARTLLRRPAEPWSVEGIAARDGRVAVELSASLRSIEHRVVDASSSNVLARAREDADCGAKVSVHDVTPASEVLVSEVRVSCGREPRASLALRLYGAGGSRTVLRRKISRDRAFRLITEPVLRAGVGGGRSFVADPDQIEIVEPTGRGQVLRRPSDAVFAGAEINDQGDLLVHAASDQFTTSLIRRGQTEPVVLVEAPLDRPAGVRLCGERIVRYARLGSGRTELSVAPVSDPRRQRRLRAWPARVADAELICDERSAVLVRRRGTNGPSSAEVVGLPE